MLVGLYEQARRELQCPGNHSRGTSNGEVSGKMAIPRNFFEDIPAQARAKNVVLFPTALACVRPNM